MRCDLQLKTIKALNNSNMYYHIIRFFSNFIEDTKFSLLINRIQNSNILKLFSCKNYFNIKEKKEDKK